MGGLASRKITDVLSTDRFAGLAGTEGKLKDGRRKNCIKSKTETKMIASESQQRRTKKCGSLALLLVNDCVEKRRLGGIKLLRLKTWFHEDTLVFY